MQISNRPRPSLRRIVFVAVGQPGAAAQDQPVLEVSDPGPVSVGGVVVQPAADALAAHVNEVELLVRPRAGVHQHCAD